MSIEAETEKKWYQALQCQDNGKEILVKGPVCPDDHTTINLEDEMTFFVTIADIKLALGTPVLFVMVWKGNKPERASSRQAWSLLSSRTKICTFYLTCRARTRLNNHMYEQAGMDPAVNCPTYQRRIGNSHVMIQI